MGESWESRGSLRLYAVDAVSSKCWGSLTGSDCLLLCQTKKGVIKSAEVATVVGNVVHLLGGGLRTYWDLPSFKLVRDQYERLLNLMNKDKALLEVILGPDPDAPPVSAEEEGGETSTEMQVEQKECDDSVATGGGGGGTEDEGAVAGEAEGKHDGASVNTAPP